MTKREVSYQEIIDKAIQLGASSAKPIQADGVVLAHWVRLKCQYGCEEYNTRLSCPPYTPSFDQVRSALQEYDTALLVEFKPDTSEDNWKITHTAMLELERWTFLRGFYKAFAMTSGPCPLCANCHVAKCLHPETARPSMEAMGVDVYQTVRNAGYSLEVIQSEDALPTYFGLLLVK